MFLYWGLDYQKLNFLQNNFCHHFFASTSISVVHYGSDLAVTIWEVRCKPRRLGVGKFWETTLVGIPWMASLWGAPKLTMSSHQGLSPPNSLCPPLQGLTQTHCNQYYHLVPSIIIQLNLSQWINSFCCRDGLCGRMWPLVYIKFNMYQEQVI